MNARGERARGGYLDGWCAVMCRTICHMYLFNKQCNVGDTVHPTKVLSKARHNTGKDDGAFGEHAVVPFFLGLLLRTL